MTNPIQTQGINNVNQVISGSDVQEYQGESGYLSAEETSQTQASNATTVTDADSAQSSKTPKTAKDLVKEMMQGHLMKRMNKLTQTLREARKEMQGEQKKDYIC